MRLGEMTPGSKFENELGVFVVLGHDRNQTKVITEKLYRKNAEFGKTCNYMESKLKKMFDEEITPEFEKVFGDALKEHEVNLMSVDVQQYGKFNCKVRPMTFDEVREFNDLIVNKELPDWWWTCTPWSTQERGWKYTVAVVSPSGNVCNVSCSRNNGVRPFCILDSNICVS